jgi:phosphoglycerate dehydrogenase-like enzyme
MRVAILDDYQQVALASADWSAVRELADIHVFTSHIARTEALVDALDPFEIIVAMRERTPFDAERLGQLPRLRLLVTTGMANASIDLDAAAARGITVCGTGGVGSATAELTWGLILALLRHIPEEDRRMKLAGGAGGTALGVGGAWQQTVGTGLDGKRLGVVGLGHQGRRVAEIGRAFGMHVVAWSQNLDPSHAKKVGAKAVGKEELFASADVVTVHYKLSPRSEGLVGAAELALMKPSAYLVNTSRGPLVDSAALLAALQSGGIAGAALDVYDIEPLPLSSPLRRAPNVVLTPHLGYVTDESYRVFYGEAVEDIVAFADGTPVRVLSPLPRLSSCRPPSRYRSLWHVPVSGGHRSRAEVQRRAGAGVIQCVPDFCYDLSGVLADLLGREGQQHDPVLAHPPLPLERPGVIFRRHVPLARVNLDRHAELGPPCVWPGHERIPRQHRRVEQRHRQSGPGEQVLEVSFRGRPDAVGDIGERLAEQRRPSARAGTEFPGQARH